MSRKLFQASVLTLAMASPEAFALGLGGLSTQSALNQPFVGEIELFDVKPDELDTLQLTLASPEAFTREGLERYHFLTRLEFTPLARPDGTTVVRVSTRDPVREPYLDFLVTAVWPQGRLMKGYTVLLDPPLMRRERAPAISAPVAGSLGAGGSAARLSGPGRADDGMLMQYGPVPRGTGLWRIAREKTPSGATVAQTAMALYRSNQHAFIRGDINRLLAGETLTIPSRDELFALDAAEAQREFRAALNGAPVRRAPIAPPPARSAEAEQPRLRLAGEPSMAPAATPRAGSPSPNQQDVLLALETSESARQETSELRGRIRELERQLSGIEELLQLRNAELARLRDTDPDVPAMSEGMTAELPDALPVSPETGTTPDVPEDALLADGLSADEPLVEDQPEAAVSDEPVSAVDEQAAGGVEPPLSTAEVVPPVDLPDATEPESTQVPVPEQTPDSAGSVAPEAQPEPSQPPATPAPSQPEPEQPAERSLWYALLLPLAGFAGVIALGILAFSWWSARRRQAQDADAQEDLESDPEAGALPEGAADAVDAADVNVAGGDAGHHDPTEIITDHAHTEILGEDHAHTEVVADLAETRPALDLSKTADDSDRDAEGNPIASASGTGLTPIEENDSEGADALAEADIYLVYGRHDEAERLLRAEIARNPSRLDAQFKLADACFAQGKIDCLQEVSDTIQALDGPQQAPEQWARLQDHLTELLAASPSTPGAGASTDTGSLDLPSLATLPDVESEEVLDLNLDSLIHALPEDANGQDPDAPLRLDTDVMEPMESDSTPVPETPSTGSLDAPSAPRTSGTEGLSLSLDGLQDMDASDFQPTTPLEPTSAQHQTQTQAEPAPLAPPEPLADPAASTSDAPSSAITPGGVSELTLSQWETDSGLWDENATKLDLAQAYIDMGDQNAARGILDEVMADGSEAQRSKAQSMLATLD